MILDKIWLLKKPVYGLKIASRKQYNKICFALLPGVLGGHVDDFFWSGTEDFEKQIIEKICSKFKISTTAKKNSVPWVQLKQTVDSSVIVEQYAYTDDLKYIHIKDSQDNERPLNHNEQANLLTAIGRLCWVSNQTQPDISFNVRQLSAVKKKATVKHLQHAKKTIKKLKNSKIQLRFPSQLDIKSSKLVVYSDASFKNLPVPDPKVLISFCGVIQRIVAHQFSGSPKDKASGEKYTCCGMSGTA